MMETRKKGANVGNSHTYDVEKLYARLLVVSQHGYIHVSDLWERTAGKLCSGTVCIKWIHKQCSGVRGDLSLLADRFSCKRCDVTIQQADLAGKQVVYGKTYGCVKSFS